MTALVCDIGGTNTRLGLVVDGGLADSSLASYANGDFADFDALLEAYLRKVDAMAVDSVCIALAAVPTPDGAQLTNREWTIERSRVAAISKAADVHFINDFEALGFSLAQVERLETESLFPGNRASASPGPRLVLGAGTGFNAAAFFPPKFGIFPHVTAAECGHMTLPLAGEDECSLQTKLSKGRGRASVERALSGNGLAEIYEWVCDRAGRPPQRRTPSDIACHAVSNTDPDCRQAAEMFLKLLGRVAGDLALAFLPTSGIYLSGGVSRALAPLMRSMPTFYQAFCAKGRMSAFMDTFAISLLLDDRAALSGCVEWLQLSTFGSQRSETDPAHRMRTHQGSITS